MASNDMNHMAYIDGIAANDADILRMKESTYQGSWKRAGGRSAWFMARRNMDRIITMLAPPKKEDFHPTINMVNIQDSIKAFDEAAVFTGMPNGYLAVPFPGEQHATKAMFEYMMAHHLAEDIFKMIEANPDGSDGTVLASIRDLRRYLLLVEAEMHSEGHVHFESVPKEFTQEEEYSKPQHDVYQLIADEKGVPRDVVKEMIHELFYATKAATPAPVHETRQLNPQFSKIFSEGLVYEHGRPPRLPTAEEQLDLDLARGEAKRLEMHTENTGTMACPICGLHTPHHHDTRSFVEVGARALPRMPPRTPEAGSHHASLVPHEVGIEYRETLLSRFTDKETGASLFATFWKQVTPAIFRLEPVVRHHYLPRELEGYYRLDEEGRDIWVIAIEKVPADIVDCYARLQGEMNLKEFEELSSEFKFMYYMEPGTGKWIPRPQYQSWIRVVG